MSFADLFTRLLREDNKILAELNSRFDDPELNARVYQKRLALHTITAESVSDPIVKEIIYIKRKFINLEYHVLKIENNIQEDIAKVISHLDDLG